MTTKTAGSCPERGASERPKGISLLWVSFSLFVVAYSAATDNIKFNFLSQSDNKNTNLCLSRVVTFPLFACKDKTILDFT